VSIEIGEGFAFFRWHALTYPFSSGCRGINDDRPGFGKDGCMYVWARSRQRLGAVTR
jgi:hypothetical protein